MTQLEQKIRAARRLLWLRFWLHAVCALTTVGAGVFAAILLVQRLFDAPIPLFLVAATVGGVALGGSIVWSFTKMVTPAHAAATLDRAAGLKERLSSGHYCRSAEDAFAQAVLSDAEQVSGSLSPRQHLRLTMPKPLPWTVLAVLVASVMWLVPVGLLAPTKAHQAVDSAQEMDQARVVVKERMEAVKKLADTVPALAELTDDLGDLDEKAGGKLEKPSDIRYEAIKKIDNLADAVRDKRDSEKYEASTEMRKMLRGLKVPDSAEAPTQKLARSLQAGDFKAAKEELESLREQLATLKHEEDKELVAKMGRQLDDLAKQLEKLAKDEQLAQRLEQAGVKKEDLERLLENLKKEDIEQLKKTLEENGLSQREIEKVVKQLQRRKLAGGMTQKLAQAVKQSAQGSMAGQMGDAAAGLSASAGQLSELELLEQEMNQLDSVLADLQNTRNALDRPCSSCQGRGCSLCKGGGAGLGKLGQGRGGLAPEEETSVDFKTERGKVPVGKGAIIGQFLVEGEQVKGEVSQDVAEVVSAAEHDATDRINRNRLPRQYHRAVKAYFSNVRRSVTQGELSPAEPETVETHETTGATSSTQPPSANDED